MHVILLASVLLVQDTVRFTPTVQQPTFAVREPVARIKSGSVLVSKTHFGAYYSEQGGAFPGEVGPFYVEGATTKDMLGNMDAPEVREGTTVYLPIFHDGAYLYFGDGHARQGEGEVAGTGLETSMDVVLMVSVVKGKQIDWPRLEDATHIMVAGSGRPLIDAFRLAHVELIEWLAEEYGFDKLDAYTLLGQVGENTVANIVDPAYTVLAKINKRYLR
jgi:acetamidase/formamidase